MQIRPTQSGWQLDPASPTATHAATYALTLDAALLAAFMQPEPVELYTGSDGHWIAVQLRPQTDQPPCRVLAQCRSVFDLVDLLGNELAGWELVSAKRVAG